MLRLLKPYKTFFALSTILALVLAVLGPIKPKIVQVIIDDNILNDVGIGLVNMLTIFFCIMLAESLMRYVFLYVTRWVGQNVVQDLRNRVFDHISSLRMKFFDNTPIGTLTTRTINDTEAVNRTFSDGLVAIAADILTILVIVGLMFSVNWKLALITLIPFPIILYATYVFKNKVKGAFLRVRSTLQDLNSFLNERITGMKIVQLLAIEDKEAAEFGTINNEHKQANIDTVLYYAIYFPIIEVLSSLSLALIIWFAGNQALSGALTIGVITSFVWWIRMLFRPLRMLADKFNALQMGIVASSRVFNLLDTNDVIEDPGHLVPDSLQGHVAFSNVSFGYNKDDLVLKDINFEVKPGETLALVGSTGSGKTTIISLLNRFYDADMGSLTIDGKEVKDIQIQRLRDRMATVQQDVFLFSGSVKDNIAMKDDTISMEDVTKAAKAVGVHEFISSLPNGYDYEVMERGGSLSAGQRQIISFIRAMVVDPDILVLDEATAAIDSETEALIQDASERLMKGRTAIVIAHRLSTIMNADQIIVLDQGRILEKGSHDELLSKNGAYKELYDMQFSKTTVGT